MMKDSERRRLRTCPSCWSDHIIRAGKIEGIAISSVPAVRGGEATQVSVFANICRDCGMVALFVRREDAGQEPA